MKTIRWTSAFKADYKRTMRSHRFPNADSMLERITTILSNSEQLSAEFHDHPSAVTGKVTMTATCIPISF